MKDSTIDDENKIGKLKLRKMPPLEPRPYLKLKKLKHKDMSPEEKRAIDMENLNIENENRQTIQEWERRTGKKWEGASAASWSGRKRKM
jgi:hypothetical protein